MKGTSGTAPFVLVELDGADVFADFLNKARFTYFLDLGTIKTIATSSRSNPTIIGAAIHAGAEEEGVPEEEREPGEEGGPPHGWTLNVYPPLDVEDTDPTV